MSLENLWGKYNHIHTPSLCPLYFPLLILLMKEFPIQNNTAFPSHISHFLMSNCNAYNSYATSMLFWYPYYKMHHVKQNKLSRVGYSVNCLSFRDNVFVIHYEYKNFSIVKKNCKPIFYLIFFVCLPKNDPLSFKQPFCLLHIVCHLKIVLERWDVYFDKEKKELHFYFSIST